MSEQYIEFYNKCRNADRLIVLGYGFNSDDGHINTLIRSLVDSKPGKRIEVVAFKENNISSRKSQIEKNIRCDNRNSIHVYSVDEKRKIGGKHWLDVLFPAEEE